jgi:hypothetical protein
MGNAVVEYRAYIRMLKELAKKFETSGDLDISEMIWLLIHHIWSRVVKLTAMDTFTGRESRKCAVESAIKAQNTDLARNYLASLVREINIMPDQFYELKRHFD